MRNTSVPDQTVREFLDLLAALGRRNSLRDPVAQLVASSELGPAQVHALMWLHRDGNLGMGEVAQRIGVNQKTVTGIVDRLEREAYVKRVRNPDDRRVVQVALSAKGRSLAQKLDQSIFQNVKGLLGLLDDRDRKDLFRIVEHIAEAIGALQLPSTSSPTDND